MKVKIQKQKPGPYGKLPYNYLIDLQNLQKNKDFLHIRQEFQYFGCLLEIAQ